MPEYGPYGYGPWSHEIALELVVAGLMIILLVGLWQIGVWLWQLL